MKSVSRFALSAMALSAFASPAFAQALEQPTTSADSGETMIVTAQRRNQSEVSRGGNLGALGDQDAANVPFSIRSYNEALILNQQPQTLGQVLENDPSIRTTYGFGNAAELFIIRGFVLAGDDIGLDGLYGIAPRQLVAPELYDSVQVLNGASAFLYGASPGGGGIGGSVNLQLKRAERDLLRATLGYTSNEHFGGSLDFGRRFGSDRQFGVRINGAFRSGDVSIDGEFRETTVIAGAFDYNRGPLRLTVDLAYQDVEVRGLRGKVQLGTNAIPAVPEADHNFSQPWNYTQLRDLFGIARVEYDVANDVTLYAAFGARDGSEEGRYDSISVTDVTTGAANGGGSFIPRTDNNEAAEAGVHARFATGPVTHQLNAGGSINWQVNRNAYDFFGGFATNLYNTPVAPIPASAFAGGDLNDPFPIAQSRLGSLFVSDTLGFFGDRLLLTGGLRYQAMNIRGFSYFGGAQTSEYDEEAITPVFGIVVKPSDRFSLFFNRIEGLQQGQTAPVDPSLSNSGEVFAPFKSVQYELGGRTRLGPVNASLSLFQTELPSAFAIPDPDSPGLNVFGPFGTQRNRGIELSVDGEVTRGLRVIAGMSILEAQFTETLGGVNEGNQVAGVPDYLANANVEWDMPFVPGLTLTGRVVHTGAQPVNNANTLELSDWTRVDLGARYVAAIAERPVTFRAGVDNVFNERYWASAFDSFLPQLLQGAPRTFKLSVSIDM